MKYKMKPQKIDAILLTDKNRAEVIAFLGEQNVRSFSWDTKTLRLPTLDEAHDRVIVPGNYIIKRADGAFEVVEKETFEAMYEKEGMA